MLNLIQARALAIAHPGTQTGAPWTLSTFALEAPSAFVFYLGPRGWSEDLDDTQAPMDPVAFIVDRDTGAVTTTTPMEMIHDDVPPGPVVRAGTWPGSRPVSAPGLGA